MKIHLFVFFVEKNKYALRLSKVERIIPVMRITPLPSAPEIVMGVINIEGNIIPTLNIRKRFGLQEKELNLYDKIIIAYTAKQRVAIVVDDVAGVVEYEEEKLIPSKEFLPVLPYFDGVMALEDQIILIHDIDRFLSINEECLLEAALC